MSFEVNPGTTFALIGHNGSGKSTMLKCLARILECDQGSTRIDGKMSALLELGAGFHPELSGRENVYLNGSILGLSKRQIDRRFDDIVGFAGLERFIDSPVKNYSSGMYVRLGFSVAINVDPDVLLIDEVLAVGDEEFQRKCLERINDLRDAGKTIVVVTHSLMTVRSLCDEAVWLENGEMKAYGKADEVADAYLGKVQVEKQAQEEADPESKWSKVRITGLELLDSAGGPSRRVRTGEQVTFRLHYEAARAGAQAGLQLLVPHARRGAGERPQHPRGQGLGRQDRGQRLVDMRVDRLMLLLGDYDLSAECVNETVTHSYDRRHRDLRFMVRPGAPHETYGGLVSLDPRWSIG